MRGLVRWIVPGFVLSFSAGVNAHPAGDEPGSHLHEVLNTTVPDRQSPVTGATSWKVALHIHGILSEGDASVRSYHELAKMLGIDVLWWTDHDHMIVSEAHRATRYSFDALSESLPTGERWTPSSSVDIVLGKGASFFRTAFTEQEAVITSEQVAVGTGSMKMSGRRQFSNRGSFMYLFNADGTRRRVSVAAGLTLKIKVYPEVTGPDATGVMTMILSRTINPNIVSTNRLELQYYLSNGGEPPTREDYIYRIPVPFVPNQWNEITLPITQDAIAGYPFLDGEENSLTEVLFGLESKNNALTVCYYDDLRLEIEADGEALFAKQRVILDGYTALNEGVRHHQGIEHSYILPHLLEYGPDTPLPDWVAYHNLSPGIVNGFLVNGPVHNDFIANRVVTLGHERGAAVSYAHPFGTGTPTLPTTPSKEQLLAKLLSNQLYNADLLEVGYRQRERPMADHLWVWDQLALNNKIVTGIGVSDSHGGLIAEYLNEATYSMTQFVYADSSDETPIAEGLRAGRGYYADPVIYDGVMDIEADNGAVMGNIVVTDRDTVDVTVRIRGLQSGDQVKLIDSGVVGSSMFSTQPSVDLPYEVVVSQTRPTFVRAEVFGTVSNRPEKAFSNPIYFVRQVPGAGIDWRRAFVDMHGVIASSFDRFRLDTVKSYPDGQEVVLAITGHEDGGPGGFALDLSALEGGVQVTLGLGLTGDIVFDGDTVLLSNLVGHGPVLVRFVPPTPPCIADVNLDGSVDVDDLNIVLSRWGLAVPPNQQGDLTGNGVVDVDDLNIVLSQWAANCG